MFASKTGAATLDAITTAMNSLKMNSNTTTWNREEHQIWCQQVLSTEMKLTVSEPETRGSYLTKYITYLVRQDPQNYKVRRRYSDFEWLHKTLSSRYIGMVIPSLPEKNVYKTDQFIKGRIRGLNLFMNHIANTPYFRDDDSVLAFTSVQDEKEWENAKKETTVVENAGIGHLRWLAALKTHTIPENAERVILDVKRQTEPLEKHLSAISASTKRLADKTNTVAKEMMELKGSFSAWKGHEMSCTDPSKVEYVISHGKGLGKFINETACLIGTWSDIAQFQPSIDEFLLHENIKYLLQQVKDLRELLKFRDSCIINYDKSKKNWRLHEDERDLVADKGNTSRISKLDFAISEDATSMERLSFTVDYITKALFFSELERFNRTKSFILEETMGQLAAAQFQYAKKLGMVWQNYMNETHIDAQAMMANAKSILEIAGTAEGDEAASE